MLLKYKKLFLESFISRFNNERFYRFYPSGINSFILETIFRLKVISIRNSDLVRLTRSEFYQK